MINRKTNLRHEISQIKCKFSVHYFVYNNCKLILGAAIGRGLENLESLKFSNCYRHTCTIEIIQEYLQKGSVFIKLEVSNLKNEFLGRCFSRIFLRIK